MKAVMDGSRKHAVALWRIYEARPQQETVSRQAPGTALWWCAAVGTVVVVGAEERGDGRRRMSCGEVVVVVE